MKLSKEEQKELTANKILAAACKVFPEYGFAGTSISMLAKEANINQSLIYHHFGNKEELWKATKAYLLRDIFLQAPVTPGDTSLEEFIKSAVISRFHWYRQHPEVIRMIQWQRLDSKRKQLQASAPSMLDTWVRLVPRMQKEGKIRADLSVEMILTLLTNMVILPLLEEEHLIFSEKDCDEYLQLVIKTLVEMLHPK